MVLSMLGGTDLKRSYARTSYLFKYLAYCAANCQKLCLRKAILNFHGLPI